MGKGDGGVEQTLIVSGSQSTVFQIGTMNGSLSVDQLGQTNNIIPQLPDETGCFVSLATCDHAIALLLKALFEEYQPALRKVWVAKADLKPGKGWFAETEAAIRSARMLVLIMGPGALTRPWLSFESGSAWGRNIPLLILNHSGMTVDDMRGTPYENLQTIDMDSEDGIIRVFKELEIVTGVACAKTPNYQIIKEEMKKAKAESRLTREKLGLTDGGQRPEADWH